jgi:hypothetical protein
VSERAQISQQAMLYEYVEKQYDRVAPRPPVLAPPALLDDDNEDQDRGNRHDRSHGGGFLVRRRSMEMANVAIVTALAIAATAAAWMAPDFPSDDDR